jgi:hypothetical protein
VNSVAFRLDGARILTGSADQTAKVWDARSGTPLLELKGHTGAVMSVAFSPDGARILTGSAHQPAKVRDARSGTPLLELKGHTGAVMSVAFSPDGSRIVASSEDNPAPKEWDARTGQELAVAPNPSTPRPGQISRDGRWIAHILRDRVELIPLQPDEEELSHRRLLMQPNYKRYREGYLGATKAYDEFAARFYLNLVPPPERPLLQAKGIVTPLFARLLLRDDVLAAIQAQLAADLEIQAACLKLVKTWPESAEKYNTAARTLVSEPGQPDGTYQRGFRLAKAACRLEPENRFFLNTLGVAQYRCGLLAEALATLNRSNDLNKGKELADLAFVALAQHRLGQSEMARSTVGRLREVIKNPQSAGDPQAQAFLREAETIEFDQVFPADPFAP